MANHADLPKVIEATGIDEAKLKRKITSADVEELSKEYSLPWESLPYKLAGIKKPKKVVDEIKADHKNDTEKVKRKALLTEWTTKNASDATFLALINGLLECGNRNCAEEICSEYVKGKVMMYIHYNASSNYFNKNPLMM